MELVRPANGELEPADPHRALVSSAHYFTAGTGGAAGLIIVPAAV